MRKSYALLAIPMIAFSILTTPAAARAAGGPCDQFNVGSMESGREVAAIELEDGSYRLTDTNGTTCRAFTNGITILTNTQQKISATFVGGDLVTLYSMTEGEESRLEFEYNQDGTSNVKVTLHQKGKLPETDVLKRTQVDELSLLVTGNQPQAVVEDIPTPAN
jgi:hypothetical protein